MPKSTNYGASLKRKMNSRWVEISRVSKTKHTGTTTSSSTRTFANRPGMKVPKRVELSVNYLSDSGVSKTRSMEVFNPKVKKGKRYDAGHKFGQQLGGTGRHSWNIFPQHPVPNRYPGKGTAYTLSQNWVPKKRVDSWRRMEDKIRRKVTKYPNQKINVRFRTLEYWR